MVQQAMSGRWAAYEAQLPCIMFLVLVFGSHGYCSLNSEGLALLQFRARVDFDPSGALANWNASDCTPCMWSGVHCLDGKVHILDLNGHGLEGVLAPELGSLSHLRILDLSKNHLSGTIPQEFGQLTTLEVLDLRDNKLNGMVPTKLGRLQSLKRLVLCNNSFEGNIPVEIRKLGLLADLHCDGILSPAADGVGCMSRKLGHCIWQSVLKQSQKSNSNSFQVPIKGTIIRYLNLFPLFKLGSESPHDHVDNSHKNLTGIDLPKSGVTWNIENEVNNVRRVLLEEPSNLVASPPNVGTLTPPGPSDALPSRSSGSFPAIPNGKKLSHAPIPSPASQEHKTPDATNPDALNQPTGGKSGHSLKLIVGLSVLALLFVLAVAMLIICRSRAARTIGPWNTGLSGQLQKAFITGVPKLNRPELETACEDFSNIVSVDDGVATVYKGTLSSGVEIAVFSTAIVSIKDWSKRAELVFRKKIDNLSRVNHKNFVNLIGYCEEDEPFTRMMVFEYAPNGTLFEHLHVKEVEHLDWNSRMRIIMGTAYCLQHMHDLNPPIAHFNLTSKEILLTDDYAAKIADISFWAELISKSKNPENESEHSELPPPADVETNVHSFGILLLEIISGKLPYSDEQGHLINWGAQYLNDKKTLSSLVDPTLKSFKSNELEVLSDVIHSCIQQDALRRPSMKEVIQKLRQAIDVSPEAATPRLSPLWWAELEILSAEAA
ncbi:Serine/threonine protein kinase [Handroanthus impetiginosus]|uniref:Serine/threonine protein kinase n=1 Tax=Handroanthus impetiginosus TaxID=429701 RepID=A0A2G9GU12_9LAMI|nr:Serine/threonine protein kinase [Handroanthus impetiginosus]